MNNNNEKKYISVTALNRYISYKFDMDNNLKEIYLKGELSNFKYSGKHCYFSLKDQTSEIQGMFFYPSNLSLKFKPQDGMSVLVSGYVQVYQKKGTYAIIVNKMEQEGLGLIYQQFLELKDKLSKEGLFDETRKLPIPEYPERVAIVTALTGEAINDIVSTFNRRFPLARLKLYPALVQGLDAPKDLIRAVNEVFNDNWAEVLIIGRGGGSYEDLSCFNDEALARLLASSKIPVVSAVGHEGDFTICDFVASYRAPTPTGAAMRLTKEKSEVIKGLMDKVARLNHGIKAVLSNKYYLYDNLIKSYPLLHFDEFLNHQFLNPLTVTTEKLKGLNPEFVIDTNIQKLNELDKRLYLGINNDLKHKMEGYNTLKSRLVPSLVLNKIELYKSELVKLMEKNVLLNPFNVMLKGYTIAYQDEVIIKSVNHVDMEKPLKVKFYDGYVMTNIYDKKITEE